MSWTTHIQHKLRLYVPFYTKLNIYTWFPNVVTDLFASAGPRINSLRLLRSTLNFKTNNAKLFTLENALWIDPRHFMTSQPELGCKE